MKMYRDEKTQSLLRMILFVKIFANIKRLLELHLGVSVIRWNEKDEKILRHSISLDNVLFKIWEM